MHHRVRVLWARCQSRSKSKRELPDYLPARMVNEFAYCPRLFFYEWVEGLFAESVDTVEGSIQHKRVDAKATALPDRRIAAAIDPLAQSVTLSSERLRVIAKMDLVEVEGGVVTPVDYKHGRSARGQRTGWSCGRRDRAQLAVQGIVLRENGYRCEEGVAYYRKTGQRVRVAFDEALIAETEALILAGVGHGARWARFRRRSWIRRSVPGARWWGSACRMRRGGRARMEVEEPQQLALFDVPRRKPVKREVRAADDAAERTAAAVSEHPGRAAWGRSGAVLQVKDKEKLLQEVRIGEICQVNLMGNVQISTQAVQALCEAEVPICYFSMGGWFYGITMGLNHEERVPAAEPVPAGGAGVFRAVAGAAAGGGEDSQSENDAAAEPCGAEAAGAGGHEGDGGAGGGSGVAGGIAGDRGECGADVLRGVRGDDQAGRGGGNAVRCRSISRGGTGVRREIR